jgi:hypothetical protein
MKFIALYIVVCSMKGAMAASHEWQPELPLAAVFSVA